MIDLETLGLLGVLIGGAVPWLEAVTVIPAGILLGLQPVAVVATAIVGNVSTVALAAFGGERVRTRLLARRRRNGVEGSVRGSRAERALRRFGLPGLAILGPLGLGTQLAAALGVSLGLDGRRVFLWVGAATVAWSLAAAGLVLWGVDLVGMERSA